MTDAWEQYHDLQKRFIREWSVRPDLDVVAVAHERHIELHGERHNVCTVREYIAVLQSACDFIEDSNPQWAMYQVPFVPPYEYEVIDD